MSDFFYQLKSKLKEGETNVFNGVWAFPPIFTGKVTANNRAEAQIIIQDEFQRKFPTRVLKKELDKHDLLLSIKRIEDNDYHTKRLFEVNTCLNPECGNKFKLIEKYTIGNEGGHLEYCSKACANKHKPTYSAIINQLEEYRAGYNNQKPCIYKITNKSNNKCYIGKTNQVFTLRWYQHFFQNGGSDNKFYTAIRDSDICNWTFEILEVIEPSDISPTTEGKGLEWFICARETYWIMQNNSVENGYNSVLSNAEFAKIAGESYYNG